DGDGERARRLRERELSTQRLLRARLLAEALAVVPDRQMRVGRRIPKARVDAVEDPDQIARAPAEEPLQAEAERLVLDFLGVGRADGRQLVGVPQPRLEKANLAVILEPVDREALRRQAELRQDAPRKEPL